MRSKQKDGPLPIELHVDDGKPIHRSHKVMVELTLKRSLYHVSLSPDSYGCIVCLDHGRLVASGGIVQVNYAER